MTYKRQSVIKAACVLCWTLLVAFCHAQPQPATAILIKALSSQRDTKATLVQTRSNGNTSISVIVQIVPGKGVTSKVIQPFIHAGIVSVDDGIVWKNFDPHNDSMRIERSPALFEFPVAKRMEAIAKNFQVTLKGADWIAGRQVDVVALKGVVPGVTDRTLWVDRDTSLILGYEADYEDEGPVRLTWTKSVELNNIPTTITVLDDRPVYSKVEKTWGPFDVREPEGSLSQIDFVPKVPTALPAGLEFQATHLIGTHGAKFAGVRLSDGMSMVTVYLWRKDGKTEPFEGNYDEISAAGLRCRVEGDVPKWAKKEIAKAFARLN